MTFLNQLNATFYAISEGLFCLVQLILCVGVFFGGYKYNFSENPAWSYIQVQLSGITLEYLCSGDEEFRLNQRDLPKYELFDVNKALCSLISLIYYGELFMK